MKVQEGLSEYTLSKGPLPASVLLGSPNFLKFILYQGLTIYTNTVFLVFLLSIDFLS